MLLLFTEPYLLRLPVVDSSDKGESGSVGLLLLRRFIWILLSDVCLNLVVDLRHCGNPIVVIVAQRIEVRMSFGAGVVACVLFSGLPGFSTGRGFDPSGGLPGFSTGRGFDPSGGAPGVG
ncbi:hypothetical protein F511_34631 [Dorcoceras hygrometricum]|uniref:Uncharacterized protein n=1 Tax=Dorcoceras hygrometricum TaxID=472368 RepID=A0A2Z7C3S6_9LAMI|nr:hypothetical protein F511_34631 [Dorcoceras hygrometricum]